MNLEPHLNLNIPFVKLQVIFVTEKTNGMLFLQKFNNFYELRIILNTIISYMFTSSFNEGVEPIILTPQDEKQSEGSSSIVSMILLDYIINLFINFISKTYKFM